MSNYNPFSLEGKTILVTGASSGIGKATAIECAKMGATVIITGRNEERLNETFAELEDTSKGHFQIVADLTTEEGLNLVVSSLKKLDGVVLCAGKGLTMPLQFASTEKFNSVFEINFFSPVELMRLLYKKKILVKYASVVMIASVGGITRIELGSGIYGTSKSALNAAMQYAAREFAATRRIRVNSICPGMVDTPLIHRGTITEEQLEDDMKTYPLQRYGRPEEVAQAAIYLLSNASSWVTGHSLIIDGGVSLI